MTDDFRRALLLEQFGHTTPQWKGPRGQAATPALAELIRELDNDTAHLAVVQDVA